MDDIKASLKVGGKFYRVDIEYLLKKIQRYENALKIIEAFHSDSMKKEIIEFRKSIPKKEWKAACYYVDKFAGEALKENEYFDFFHADSTSDS